MRLWHKDLIKILPAQQLISQWRECCCIAKNISANGTPNHLLVNKIMNYPIIHFVKYTNLVVLEMKRRGYKVNEEKFYNYLFPNGLPAGYNIERLKMKAVSIPFYELYCNWHTDRYLDQCYYNLSEKFDCGGIPANEWSIIESEHLRLLNLEK